MATHGSVKEPSCYEFQRLVIGLKSGKYISENNSKESQKEFLKKRMRQ